MIHKIVFFILGIIICSYSLMFIIIYLNLLKMGVSFIDYIKYVISSFEFLIIFIGIILIYLSLRKKNNNFEMVNNKNR